MSSRFANSRVRAAPSCPHCSNLGLESSHWLRKTSDKNSELVCPVLLKTECKNCNKLGHTVSHCSLKKNETYYEKLNEKMEQKMEHKNATNVSKKAFETPVPKTNRFSVLMDESVPDFHAAKKMKSESNRIVSYPVRPHSTLDKPPVFEFPEMPNLRTHISPLIVTPVSKTSFVEVLQKPKKQVDKPEFLVHPIPEKTSVRRNLFPVLKKKITNWADDYSSDDEDYDSLYEEDSVY